MWRMDDDGQDMRRLRDAQEQVYNWNAAQARRFVAALLAEFRDDLARLADARDLQNGNGAGSKDPA